MTGFINKDGFRYLISNNELRGHKHDLYEGGIRVPLIVRRKNRIEPGSVNNHVSAFWDFLPAFCEIANVKTPDNNDLFYS